MVRMSRLAHGAPSMGGALPLRPSDYPVAHPDDPTGAGPGAALGFQGHDMLRPWPGLPALTRSGWPPPGVAVDDTSAGPVAHQLHCRLSYNRQYNQMGGTVIQSSHRDPVGGRDDATSRRSTEKGRCGIDEKLGPGKSESGPMR